MHVVMLKISNKDRAAEWMAGHKAWLQKGFDDGVFLAAGNLLEQAGGGILVHGLDDEALQQRLAQDPFVEHGVVNVHITGLALSKADSRLGFLLEGAT